MLRGRRKSGPPWWGWGWGQTIRREDKRRSRLGGRSWICPLGAVVRPPNLEVWMRVGDPRGCPQPTAVPAHPTHTHTVPSELRSGPFLPSRLPDLAPIRLLQAPRPTPVRAQNTYLSLPKPQLKPQLPQPASLASPWPGAVVDNTEALGVMNQALASPSTGGCSPTYPRTLRCPQGPMCPPQVGLGVLVPSDPGLGRAWVSGEPQGGSQTPPDTGLSCEESGSPHLRQPNRQGNRADRGSRP